VKSANYKGPHYVVFTIPLLRRSS